MFVTTTYVSHRFRSVRLVSALTGRKQHGLRDKEKRGEHEVGAERYQSRRPSTRKKPRRR